MPLPSSTLLLPPGMFFPTLHVFFVALLLFKCIIIHLNSNQVRHAWGNSRMPLCPAGSLVWASDPARPAGFSPATWVELDLAP
jgi:hypothetical protein